MKQINRYSLTKPMHNAAYTVEMPKGSKIISCQWQDTHECISLWAVVNPKHPLKEREFHIFGTAFPMDDYDKKHYHYLNTVQEKGMVWHVFEVYK